MVGPVPGQRPRHGLMQRVVAGGLGAPGNASASVAAQGVRLERIGESGKIFLPADQITATEPAAGGGAGGGERRSGPVVLERWDTPLQTGFRPDAAEDVSAGDASRAPG